MTLGQSVKQTNTDENGYGREITVGSKSESIDKGHYYMPKFGFATSSLNSLHSTQANFPISHLLHPNIFTQFIYGSII